MRQVLNGVIIALILVVGMLRPTPSFAYDHDWNEGHGGYGHGGYARDHGYHDHSYAGVNFALWPDNYYYETGYYAPTDEVLVSPPVTVVQPQVIVEQPTVAAPQIVPVETVVTAAQVSDDTGDSITINIPNNKGGYTAVTLKKSGNGFIGPQGEFYPEFPKVSQLEIIYGK